MNQTEVAKIMKLILSQYRGQYKTQEDIKFATGVMEKLFADWEYVWIEKALFRFMQNDAKGFPPVPGQLITLATEIRRAEYDERQRQADLLAAPEGDFIPMPDDVRARINAIFRPPYEKG